MSCAAYFQLGVHSGKNCFAYSNVQEPTPSLYCIFFVCFPVVASSEATFDGLAYHLIVSVFMFFCSFKALVDTCCKFVGDEKLSWQDLGRKAASQVTSKLDYE